MDPESRLNVMPPIPVTISPALQLLSKECDLLDNISYDDIIDTYSYAKKLEVFVMQFAGNPNCVGDLFANILKSIKKLTKIFGMGPP